MSVKKLGRKRPPRTWWSMALLVALAALAVLASLQALSATIGAIWTVITTRLSSSRITGW